jgi:DegV family protein with EDD domain
MSPVAVVTDSTTYIPKEVMADLPITVAPQILIWGEQTYRDGVDIQPEEFYTRIKKTTVMPTTSQVTIANFKEVFERLLDQGYDILALLISAKLSGTIDSAVQAREMLSSNRIEIVDSFTTAMAEGYQVLTVARAAKEGAGLAECVALAEKARNHTGVVFAVDTLEFLHRGGRIGGASRFLATALNIKPILEVTGGAVEGIERVRTRRKSLERVIEIIEERIAGRTPVRLATLHANALDDAREILEMASGRLKPVESVFAEVSPVVGNHAGPGTVGLAFMAGM